MHYWIVAIVTLLYWIWESQAEGNIRVDLLVIYPALLCVYLAVLWRSLKWRSLLVSFGLMFLNVLFFLVSYDLFDKHPG